MKGSVNPRKESLRCLCLRGACRKLKISSWYVQQGTKATARARIVQRRRLRSSSRCSRSDIRCSSSDWREAGNRWRSGIIGGWFGRNAGKSGGLRRFRRRSLGGAGFGQGGRLGGLQGHGGGLGPRRRRLIVVEGERAELRRRGDLVERQLGV